MMLGTGKLTVPRLYRSPNRLPPVTHCQCSADVYRCVLIQRLMGRKFPMLERGVWCLVQWTESIAGRLAAEPFAVTLW